MTVVVAPVIGPTLGGWITDNYSWRWVFLINVPVGIAALSLNARFLVDPPYLRRRLGAGRWRGDFLGLAFLAIGLGCLQMTLDLGEREDWFSSSWITATAIMSGLGLVIGGFTPNPFGQYTVYTPTLPEIAIALMVWCVGFLILTVLYKVATGVKEEKALS